VAVTRSRAVLKRWKDIGLLSATGAAVIGLIAPWIVPLVSEKIQAFGLAIPIGLLLMVTCLSFAWGRVLAWLGLRHLPTYPPAWVASLLGFTLLTVFWTFQTQAFTAVSGTHTDMLLLSYPITPFESFEWWHAILALSVLAVVGWATVSIYSQRKSSDRETTPPKGGEQEAALFDRLTSDFTAFKEWLRSDAEIDDPAFDAFGHDQVARRIARRLVNGSQDGQEGPTVALVGELGSGKSSIRNLVYRRLRESGCLDTSTVFVPISLWPFDSAEAAVSGVLSKLTEGLSQHVNVADLTGLPEQYAKIIEHSGGRWSPPAQLLRGPSDPEDIIKRFEEIALAIGLKVILWIEDLERFAATENLSREQVSQRENERLAPIRSLLHFLNQGSCISVILAANTIGTRFDIDKLARFIEQPPRLDEDNTGQIIEFFIAECIRMLGQRIYPVIPNSRYSSFVQASSRDVDFLKLIDDGGITLRIAIVILCRTPRNLKQALRSALDVWEQLVGEIDFYDVLVMSVIKIAEPEVFAIVDENINVLREGPRNSQVSSQEDKVPAWRNQLEELLVGRKYEAVLKMLEFVFPNLDERPDYDYPPNRPQGIAVDRHASYWARFLNVPMLKDSERDQPVLASIDQWEREGQGTLPRMMADPSRAKAVETFSKKLSPHRLDQLLRAVINDRLSEATTDWREDWQGQPDPPGISEIWRIMHRNEIDRERLSATLHDSVRESANRNLTLADELLHWFATRESGVSNLLSEPSIEGLRKSFEQYLASLSETEIINGLRGASYAVLLRCCWSLDRLRRDDFRGLPFEGWEDFADRVLNALELEPAIMLPQVVRLIVSVRSDKYVFDEEQSRRLFDYDRLLSLLRGHLQADAVVHPHIKEAFKSVYEAINTQ
jgi:hypothetical protein